MTRAAAPRGRRLLLLVAVLAGLAEAALAHHTGRRGGILDHRWALLAELGGWWLVFAAGAVAVLRLPRRTAVVVVLLLSVVMRIAALSDKAPLSDDLYRYAWDGRVQAAGIDPYRWQPGSAALAGLRDGGWLWSEPNCPPPLVLGSCTQINRPAARTIYPPAAEAWFLALHVVVPQGLRDRGYEAAALVVDLIVLGVLLGLLVRRGRDPRWLVLYAWCPLAVVETAQNAHVDGLAVLAVLLAIGLAPRRPVLGAVLLGLAGLVKIYPFALAPALLRRRTVLGVLAMVVVTAVAYLPHVLAVGIDVLGYLPSYLQEEKYDAGGRYQLLAPLQLSATVAGAVVAAVVAGTALAVFLRRTPRDLAEPERGALTVFGVLLLLASPVQPWYALTLAALAALLGRWEWLAVGAAAYPLYFALVLDGPAARIGPWSYGAAAALVVVVTLWRWGARRDQPEPVGHTAGRVPV